MVFANKTGIYCGDTANIDFNVIPSTFSSIP